MQLCQEQDMLSSITCAGFHRREAHQLRRAMAALKFTAGVSHFRDKLIDGRFARCYEPAFAGIPCRLEGFGG